MLGVQHFYKFCGCFMLQNAPCLSPLLHPTFGPIKFESPGSQAGFTHYKGVEVVTGPFRV